MPATPLLVVLTGPSGVGKDTVLAALRDAGNSGYGFPVNATTRDRRTNEEEGVDYFFVTHDEFARRLAEGDFLEHATVYGQKKGVLKEQVRQLLESSRDAILRTDIQGARYIKSVVPSAVTVFIAPPSLEEVEHRMRSRGGDSPEQVAIRLEIARDEVAAADEFDYTVINDDLAHCLEEIEAIIEQERARPDRRPTFVD
jgi:guanylate kinase